MIRMIALLLAALALGDPPTADAAACIRRNGKLMVRETCRRSERPLDTAAFIPVGPGGEDGAPGKRSEFPLVIVDAADREVGTVLSFGFGTAVVRVTHPTLPTPASFAVSPDGFGNLGDDDYVPVYYAEAGCTGQPYLPPTLGAYAHIEGTAAYRAAGDAASVDVLSSENAGFALCLASNLTDRGTCCTAVTFTEELVPAVRSSIADLGFTVPFRTVPR
jgi:hypothetical protein